MESIKVDIRNVKTVENYAKSFGLSRPTVYKRIRSGDIKTVKIDGVTFVRV